MIKTYFLSLLSVLILFAGSCTGQQQTYLSANDFAKSVFEHPGAILLDVRTPGEFTGGHIANALNVDWNGSAFKDEAAKLDKSKDLYIYCMGGGRSTAAAKYLIENGFTHVYELKGGIMQWRAASLPEVKEGQPKASGLTKEAFMSSLSTNKIVLVDFYADWCAPCKKLKPILDEIAVEMKGKVEVVRINADENQDLCRELGINALPIMQVYKNKMLTWNGEGFMEKKLIVDQLK